MALGFEQRLLRARQFAQSPNVRFVAGTFAAAFAVWSCSRHVPEGYVALIEEKDGSGSVRPYLYGQGEVFLFNPFSTRTALMRVTPVKKKLIVQTACRDGREVEVFLQARMQPRIAFIPEIYMRFGKDYGRRFLDEEARRDVEQVAALHDYKSLTDPVSATLEDATADLMERIDDASKFHKIVIKEAVRKERGFPVCCAPRPGERRPQARRASFAISCVMCLQKVIFRDPNSEE